MKKREFDYSILEEAFELYVEEAYNEMPTEEELAHITFSPEFEKRMQKMIERQKKPYYILIDTAAKRVATVIVTILLALLATTFSVKALREPFVRFITEVFEKFTSIVFVQQDEPEQTPFVFEKTEPQHVPEGYTVNTVEEMPWNCRITYNHNHYKPISYHQQRNLNSGILADTENIEYKCVVINGLDGLMYTNKDTSTLMFCNNNYVFALTLPTILGENELIRMAESIEIPD